MNQIFRIPLIVGCLFSLFVGVPVLAEDRVYTNDDWIFVTAILFLFVVLILVTVYLIHTPPAGDENLLRRHLGQQLKERLDASVQAMKDLKEQVAGDQAGKKALRKIVELREAVERAAEELDPSIQAARIRDELTDPPGYKLGPGPTTES